MKIEKKIIKKVEILDTFDAYYMNGEPTNRL